MLSEFHRSIKNGLHGRQARCIACNKKSGLRYFQQNKEKIYAKRRLYRETHPEEMRAKDHAHHQKHAERRNAQSITGGWKRLYGLTEEQVHDLLDFQCDCCLACGRKFLYQDQHDRPHVDHDHNTKVVRGLLCGRCNLALGYLGNNPFRCYALGRYVAHADVVGARNVARKATGRFSRWESEKAGIETRDSLLNVPVLGGGVS